MNKGALPFWQKTGKQYLVELKNTESKEIYKCSKQLWGNSNIDKNRQESEIPALKSKDRLTIWLTDWLTDWLSD